MHCKNLFQMATDKGKAIVVALIADAVSEAPNFPPSGLGFLLGEKMCPPQRGKKIFSPSFKSSPHRTTWAVSADPSSTCNKFILSVR
jgi:hypothetical protein